MKINIENYESYLLDLAEGRLSAGEEKELYRFLDENSHLETDPGIINYKLSLEDTPYPFKENIKKGESIREINRDNFEQFCIARLEGDLPSSGVRKLNDFLERNPDLVDLASVYDSLVLKADKSVVYCGKPDLKKSDTTKTLISKVFKSSTISRSLSIAATFAILVTSYFFLQDMLNSRQTDISPPENIISLHREFIPKIDDLLISNNQPGIISNDLLYTELSNKEGLIKVENEINLMIFEKGGSDELKEGPTSLRAASLPYAEAPVLANLKIESLNPTENTGMNHLAALTVYTPGYYAQHHEGSRSVVGNLFSFLTRAADTAQQQPRPNLWDLAHAGIHGINTIAGTDIRFDREVDENGELVFMAFSAGIIEFQRSGSIIDE